MHNFILPVRVSLRKILSREKSSWKTFARLTFLIGALCAQAPAHSFTAQEAHPRRVIVKIKSSSPLRAALFAAAKDDALTNGAATQAKDKSPAPELVRTINLPDNRASSLYMEFPVLQALADAGVLRIELPMPAKTEKFSPLADIVVVECAEALSAANLLQNLALLPHIRAMLEYAEPDYIGYGAGFLAEPQATNATPDGKNPALLQYNPSDPFFPLQWGLRNTGQVVGNFVGKAGADANLTAAWPLTEGADSLILAVLDSGQPVNAAQFPDFQGRLLEGYDFVNSDNDPTDDHGHGSNVMSIAAARGNNGAGIAGVDWRCKILSVKVLNQNNSGLYSQWIRGVQFAVERGAKIINMSLGGSGVSAALEEAVAYARRQGAIVVACMMNTNNDERFYPAFYPTTIAVGAINNRGNRARPFCFSASSGSNFGQHIDVVAPGELIAGYRHTDGAVTNWCGTSQATPIVSGVISQMLSVNPTLSFEQIKMILEKTSRDGVGDAAEDTPGWDRFYGWGLVDAGAAVQAALAMRPTSVALRGGAPVQFSLEVAYPNPSREGETTFLYRLERPAAYATLHVQTVQGVTIARITNANAAAGLHTARWLHNDAPSGAYIYKLETPFGVAGGVCRILR
jgi:subtilisin family serine protease